VIIPFGEPFSSKNAPMPDTSEEIVVRHAIIPVPLTNVLAAIPPETIRLGIRSATFGIDAWGMPCLFLIFRDEYQRDDFRSHFAGRWVSLPDRSACLDYILTWRDVSGYGLQLTTSRNPMPPTRPHPHTPWVSVPDPQA
jgi:hypothetical protein